MQKDEYDEASAWILVFGEVDESKLEAYDDTFESIALRKQTIVLDLT